MGRDLRELPFQNCEKFRSLKPKQASKSRESVSGKKFVRSSVVVQLGG